MSNDILLDSTFSQSLLISSTLSMLFITVGQTLFPIGASGGTLYRQDIFIKSFIIALPSFLLFIYFTAYDQSGYGGPQQPMPNFPGQQYLNDPMANVALQYGTTIADQGKDYLHKNVGPYLLHDNIL